MFNLIKKKTGWENEEFSCPLSITILRLNADDHLNPLHAAVLNTQQAARYDTNNPAKRCCRGKGVSAN